MNQKSLDKPIYVSKCCNSEMTVVGDSFGEGTNHYECNKCHQPCDILEKKPKYYCNPLDPDSTLNKDWNSPVEGLSEKKPSTGKLNMGQDGSHVGLGKETRKELDTQFDTKTTIKGSPNKYQEIDDEFDKMWHKDFAEVRDVKGGLEYNCLDNQKYKDFIHKQIDKTNREWEKKLLIKDPIGGFENSFNNRIKEILNETKTI